MSTQRKRTIGYFLRRLPNKSDREKAIRNAKSGINTLNVCAEHQSMSSALHSAFTWSESPEGFHYWNNLYHQLWIEEETK
jgi:hypothetical protein